MTQSHSDRAPQQESEPRRNFLVEALAVVFGGIVSLGPLVIGLVPFLDPLRRKQPPLKYRGEDSGTGGAIKVANRAALAEDGTPRRFVVMADKIDAWNFTQQQPVGAVYISLVAQEGSDTPKVQVFNTTCPHAGCSVSYSSESDAYLCPCHNSAFNRDGTKAETAGRENPSPRPLDLLEIDQERFEQTGDIYVHFANFYTGRAEKKQKP